MTKPLTPEDLENPLRKSGYDKVGSATAGKNGGGKTILWRATLYAGPHTIDNKAGVKWRGPSRQIAREAAQDYCDYVNGTYDKPLLSSFDPPTIDMGTTVHSTKAVGTRPPSVTVKREKFVGPHDLYDVLIYDEKTGQVFRRKIGISANGEKRYYDIAITFGFSIKPFSKAVTYPSESAALAAEKLRIAEVQKDPDWRQVGKESFALAVGTRTGRMSCAKKDS